MKLTTTPTRILATALLLVLAASGAAQAVDVPLKVHVILPSGCAPEHPVIKINSDVDLANEFFQAQGWQFFIAEMHWLCDDNLSILPDTGNRDDNIALRDQVAAAAGNAANAVNVYYMTQVNKPDAAVADPFANRLFIPFSHSGDRNPHALPHELGHLFGLAHTQAVPRDDAGRPLAELVNGDECDVRGDRMCDTPADPGWSKDMVMVVNGDRCLRKPIATPTQDANGDTYAPDFGNIMGYYHNECITGFSADQFAAMTDYYNTNGPYDMQPGLWVCAGPACQYRTLHDAVDAVAPGATATIAVGPGTIPANVEVTGGKNLTIVGAGRLNTTLDGQGNGRVFRVAEGSSLTVENLRITGGHSRHGGGIGIFATSTVTLRNVGVTANHSTRTGGGVHIWAGSTLSLFASMLTGNTADVEPGKADCFKQANGIVNAGNLTNIATGNC